MLVPETKPRELPPEGAHVARCYMVVDLGTQRTTYMGEETKKHQVHIGWELPNELMQDERPFGQFQTYTWSMSEKGNLRKHLESWRGKKFTEEDLRGPGRFNVKHLIGAVCILTIVHKTSADGEKTYANIAAISPLPKGMAKVPPAVNKPVYLGLTVDGWDIETFNAMPDWMREKIEASPEYRALFNNGDRVSKEPDFPGDRPAPKSKDTYDPDSYEPDYGPMDAG